MAPYLSLTQSLASYSDALFETMSGFTATGATIVQDIEALPKVSFYGAHSRTGLVVWESSYWLWLFYLFWVLVVFSCFLQKQQQLGRQIAPTNQPHCKRLWYIYVGFTAPGSLMLALAGMSFFRCHKSLNEYDGIWWVLNQKRSLGLLEQQSDYPVYRNLIYVFGRNEFCPYLFWIKGN
ncbi:MAG: hypothetical protein CM15mP59_2820 [Flavobacteriaceae bacterium]|nr:MAG: hypothetical protein CM15mP59_2820 [Flavobacteriaceae bacterium]